jgi:hypothetical protein
VDWLPSLTVHRTGVGAVPARATHVVVHSLRRDMVLPVIGDVEEDLTGDQALDDEADREYRPTA